MPANWRNVKLAIDWMRDNAKGNLLQFVKTRQSGLAEGVAQAVENLVEER